MTRYAPLWQQAGSYSASLDRGLLNALWPGGGVLLGGKVTADANTMNIRVASGTMAVAMGTGSGTALCRWSSDEILTLNAAPGAGTSRVDLIVCQYRDNSLDSGGNNDFVFAAIPGTPAASNPATPGTPLRAQALATVLVPGAAANLNAATITDVSASLGTDPAWTTMTPLLNGWTADGSVGPPQYRRFGGLVYLRGGVNGATMNSVMFTLPSGYRPLLTAHFAVRATSSVTLGQIQVQGPTGSILPNVAGTPSGSQFVALAGVAFDPDGN